jgi:hypothetical protein
MGDFSDYPHQSTFSRHLQKFIVPTAKKIGGVNVGLIGETRDFLWSRFRPGNRYSGQGAKGFLRECLKILPQRIRNIRARGDSSFFDGAFLEEMEKHRANVAHFFLVMLAYNLMNWFKEGVLGQKKVKRMAKWIRQRFFFIAGKLVRRGRRWILNLPKNWPWQEEYRQAERRLDALGFP